MTVDTDKLKALALAATQGKRRWWACRDGDHDYVQIAAGPERIAQIRILTLTEADLNLFIATDPATVLALIAEVKRLRADAGRWRFRKQFLAGGGAIMFSQSGCQLRRAGELVAVGTSEEEAVDAAIEKEKA